MFDYIGKTLKMLAKIAMVLGFICVGIIVIVEILAWISAMELYSQIAAISQDAGQLADIYWEHFIKLTITVVVGVFGVLLLSSLIYGIGEGVDCLQDIRQDVREIHIDVGHQTQNNPKN